MRSFLNILVVWLCLLVAPAHAVLTMNYQPAFGGSSSLGVDGRETDTAPFRASSSATGSATTDSVYVSLSKNVTAVAGYFYTPAYASSTVIQAGSRFYFVACVGSSSSKVTATLLDYDPVTGSSVTLDSAFVSVSSKCGTTIQSALSFNTYDEFTIAAGHRLKIKLEVLETGSTSDYIRIYDGSSVGNTVFTVVEGAGSQIGNCMAAGSYASSWGVMRVFGADGKPRIAYNSGETINFQFGSYQSFGATSSSKSSLFYALKSASASNSASSKTLNASGTLYSATAVPSGTGAYYAWLKDISDLKPVIRTFLTVGSEIDSLKFYSDSNYSVQTDTFSATDTVYAVLSSPALNFTGISSLYVYDFNNSGTKLTASSVSAKNGLLKFSFVPGTKLANGDWGAITIATQQSNISKTRTYYRNIRRLDSGCTYCAAIAPYDVSMSARTASSITLTWTPDTASNTGYKILRNGVVIASNVSGGSYVDNSLDQGTTYTYTVRGQNGGCESSDSNPVNAETLSNPGAFNARDCGTGSCGNSRSDGSSPSSDNKLRTKVAGTAFSVEVYSTVSGFNKWSQVTAELWDASDSSGALDAATNCHSSYVKISAAPVSLVTTGSKQVATFSVNNAYKNVVVKASFSGTPASSGCSIDRFAIRPSNFALVSGDTAFVQDSNWTTAGSGRYLNNTNATSGNVHRAGRPMQVRAVAMAGAATATLYNGSPVGNISAVVQPTSSSCATAGVTCDPGAFDVGTWTISSGVLTTTTATYSEVGSIAMTLEDATFAAVDENDGSTASERTISSASFNVGRFVPDAYEVVGDGVAPTLKAGCSSASFLGQPMVFQSLPVLTATPVAYSGNPADPLGNEIQNLTGTLARSSTNMTAAASWTPTPGLGTINTPSVTEDSANPGNYLITLNSADTLGFARPSLPSGTTPFCLAGDSVGACAAMTKTALSLDVIVTDKYADGNVTGSLQNTNGLINAAITPAGSPLYFGQLQLFHALGSGLLSLPVKAEVQTWNGSSFVAYTGTCSALGLAAGQVAMAFPVDTRNKLTGCSQTQISMTANDLSTLKLSPPGGDKNGWVDLTWNLGASATGTTCTSTSGVAATTANATWLQGINAAGTAYDANPTARGRFGIRANKRVLFLEAR